MAKKLRSSQRRFRDQRGRQPFDMTSDGPQLVKEFKDVPVALDKHEADMYRAPVRITTHDSVTEQLAARLTDLVGQLQQEAPSAKRLVIEQLMVERVKELLRTSGLNNDQKLVALKEAGMRVGVPFPEDWENDEPLRKEVKKFLDTSPQKTGNISFTRDQIPSVTGGKSPAMDFTHALQQGNPNALRMVQQATGMTPDFVQGPDGGLILSGRKKESLADVFMASTYEWCKFFHYSAKHEKQVQPILNHYRQLIRRAHRFTLDNQFTEYATEVSNRMKPETLYQQLKMATLPYETTWIEFNLRVKVRTMRQFHGLSPMPEDGSVAERMGILLTRIDETAATVEMIGEDIGGEVTSPTLSGYIYSLDGREFAWNKRYNGMTPFSMSHRAKTLVGKSDYWAELATPEAQEVIDGVSRGAPWGFGSKSGVIDYHNIGELRCPPFLLRHGEVCFSPFYDFFEYAGRLRGREVMSRLSQAVSNEIAEFAGMMRWIVTVLGMLNEVPTRSEYVQPSHAIKAGLTRRLPAFDFHRITLKLPKTKPVPYLERTLSNVERKHRAHMVREFWRTYLEDNPCPRGEHEWNYDYENDYRLCGKCMSFGRLIHEHKRGDESLGWIHHEYTIKKGGPS